MSAPFLSPSHCSGVPDDCDIASSGSDCTLIQHGRTGMGDSTNHHHAGDRCNLEYLVQQTTQPIESSERGAESSTRRSAYSSAHSSRASSESTRSKSPGRVVIMGGLVSKSALPSFLPVSNAWRKTTGDVDVKPFLFPHTALSALPSSQSFSASSFDLLITDAKSLIGSNIFVRAFVNIAQSDIADMHMHIPDSRTFDIRDSFVRRHIDCKIGFFFRIVRSPLVRINPWSFTKSTTWRLIYFEIGVGFSDAVLMHKAATITCSSTLPPRSMFVELDDEESRESASSTNQSRPPSPPHEDHIADGSVLRGRISTKSN